MEDKSANDRVVEKVHVVGIEKTATLCLVRDPGVRIICFVVQVILKPSFSI